MKNSIPRFQGEFSDSDSLLPHFSQKPTIGTQMSPSTVDEIRRVIPLSSRMRPTCLNEYIGQEHIIAPGLLLRRAIEADRIQSLIFYGPPGTGKTSLANLIAKHTKSYFEKLSGVESNVSDMRKVLALAANRLHNTGYPTILFVDEIHRFNKSQQDVLLPEVESGTVRLIGATTHNPFFFINAPLVSRSQIFELKPLSQDNLIKILTSALQDKERGLGRLKLEAMPEAISHLAKLADGDARKALNALEIAALTTPPDQNGIIRITLPIAEESIQRKAVVYDGNEDAHYDTISAFIKSMRGGDPDAAVYWLAKMIYAGEDPRFIARRIIICAAEDVGLADPMALVLANSAANAAEFIGWPEARIPLAEAAIYIATAHKSNSTILAIDAALKDVRTREIIPVPNFLKDSHYPGAEKLEHGTEYLYTHNYPEHFIPQDYLGVNRIYYQPTEEGTEKKIKDRSQQWREAIYKIRSNKSNE